MAGIIECIPNFSEGRNIDILNKLAKTAGGISGVMLLDYSADADHNRSVFTLAGGKEGIAEAAFQLCRTATLTIDLGRHSGEHPRMGATDVVPFVPLHEATMQDCVEISKIVAQRISQELGIPTFLYEEAASAPHRKNLADVRRGEFEGMPEKLLKPEWEPDYGGLQVHPTAGVTAVGARHPLIAFNVNLSTDDVGIAKAIAKSVRGSSGGFSHCKAIGLFLTEKGCAQVSMNMVNYNGTPLYRALEAIRFEARRWGVSVVGTELIGLAPAKALIDCAEYYLQIEDFDFERQVLENHFLP